MFYDNGNNGNWILNHIDSSADSLWKDLLIEFKDYLKSKRVLGHFDNLAAYLIFGLYEEIQPIGPICDYHLSYLSTNQKDRIFQASVRAIWRERKRLSRKTEKEIHLDADTLTASTVSEVEQDIENYKQEQKFYLYSHRTEIDRRHGDKACMILKLLLEALPRTLSLRYLSLRTSLDRETVKRRLDSLRTDENFFVTFLATFQGQREIGKSERILRDSQIGVSDIPLLDSQDTL